MALLSSPPRSFLGLAFPCGVLPLSPATSPRAPSAPRLAPLPRFSPPQLSHSCPGPLPGLRSTGWAARSFLAFRHPLLPRPPRVFARPLQLSPVSCLIARASCLPLALSVFLPVLLPAPVLLTPTRLPSLLPARPPSRSPVGRALVHSSFCASPLPLSHRRFLRCSYCRRPLPIDRSFSSAFPFSSWLSYPTCSPPPTPRSFLCPRRSPMCSLSPRPRPLPSPLIFRSSLGFPRFRPRGQPPPPA